MSHFLKGFIIFSILLNLLLAGIVLGNAGRYFMKSPEGYTWQEIGMALPADAQAQFKKTMEPALHDTDELRSQISGARKKMLELIKADPFNKEACLAQMQQVRQLRIQIMQRMSAAVSEFAEQLSPGERVALADMLHHPPHPSANQ